MLQLSKYLVLSVLLIVLGGCSSQQKTASTQPQEVATSSLQEGDGELGDTLSYLFAIAQTFERRGNRVAALSAYEQALRLDPHSQFLKDRVIKLAMEFDQPEIIVRALQQGKPLEELPDSLIRNIALTYSQFDMYDKAALSLLAIQSKDFDDSLRLAYSFEKQKMYTEAIAYYEKLYPNPPLDMQLYIANLYRYSLDIETASEKYQEILARGSSDSAMTLRIEEEAVNGLSLILLNTDEIDSGLTLLTQFIASEDSLRGPFYMSREILAEYYWSQGEIEKAISNYETLVRLANSPSQALRYEKTVGYYLYLTQQYEQAKEIYEDILTDSTKFRSPQIKVPEMFYLYGATLAGLKDFEGAHQAYTNAILLDSLFIEPYKGLVVVYLEQERLDEAYTLALDITLRFPQSSSGWALSGMIASMREEYDDAVTYLSKAVELRRDPTSLLMDLAHAFSQSGDDSAAIATLETLIESDSTNAPAANYLGYLYAVLDTNLTRAQNLIEYALEVSPTSGAYLDSYGWVLYRQGKYELALEYLFKALEVIEPMDYVVYSHIAEVYQALKKYDKAREYYTKALDVENVNLREIEGKLKELDTLQSPQGTLQK